MKPPIFKSENADKIKITKDKFEKSEFPLTDA